MGLVAGNIAPSTWVGKFSGFLRNPQNESLFAVMPDHPGSASGPMSACFRWYALESVGAREEPFRGGLGDARPDELRLALAEALEAITQ